MGGVAGHLAHLHESMDLTFGEIKDILRDVAAANLEVVEKVDGQNIFFGWDAKTGQLRTARNAGDITKGGMTPQEYASKWKGHPAEGAFMSGFSAIEQAVKSMSKKDLVKIFGRNNDRYVNAEIMYSSNPNMIHYDGNYIVVHNLQSFEGGEQGVVDTGEFESLVSAIEGFDAKTSQDLWKVYGPQLVALQDISDGKHYDRMVADLGSASGGMSDSATVGDFVAEKLRSGPVGKLKMPVERQEALIRRIVGLMRGDDTKSLPDLKALKQGLDKETIGKISEMATTSTYMATVSAIVAPIERVISNFAIEVLRGMQSFFVSDHDAEVQRMRAELEDAVNKIKSSRGSDAREMGDMLVRQLEKLGHVENVAQSIEGVVFEYPPGSRQLYKLTGSFAMVNQIVGRARRMAAPAAVTGESRRRAGYLTLPFLLG